jgi:hypothetical protein
MSRPRRLVFIAGGGPIAAALAIVWLASSILWCRIPVRLGTHLYNIDFSIGCIWVSDFAVWNPTDPTPLNEPLATFAFSGIAKTGRSGWRLLPAFDYTGPVSTPPPVGSRLNIRWQLVMPLYPLFLILGIPAILMLRSERNRKRHAHIGSGGGAAMS